MNAELLLASGPPGPFSVELRKGWQTMNLTLPELLRLQNFTLYLLTLGGPRHAEAKAALGIVDEDELPEVA